MGKEIPNRVLLDNFEYLECPRQMGWIPDDPLYSPFLPFNLYYIHIQTIFDYEEGDRVLDVFRPASVFLPKMPPFSIKKNASYVDTNGTIQASIPSEYNLMSVKIRALRIDYFDDFYDTFRFLDTFQFIVDVKTTNKGYAKICMIPQDKVTDGYPIDFLETVEENIEIISTDNKMPSVIEIYMGTQFIDCSWHWIEVDLNEAVKKYSIMDEKIDKILSVTILGDKYNLDDIIFKKGNPSLIIFYQDTDGDGYGDPNYISIDFDTPDGFVYNGNDCNDHDPNIHPDVNEVCDGVDNNCDGQIDNINEVCIYTINSFFSR